MTARSIYLDWNATALVRPEAAAAVAQALAIGGNPSSVHAAGRAARGVMERARAQVAQLIAMPAGSIVFTSGAAEANALAIMSAVAGGSRRLIIGAIEHETVVETAKASGAAVEVLPIDARGVADLDWLKERLARWDAADGAPFLALMLANNENGVIQPVAEAGAMVREAGGLVHVDAVQAAGKIPIDMKALHADTLALTAHKLGGPAGSGALAFASRARLVRQLHGGGQERSVRAGTENVSGIAGFGAAAEAALRGLYHDQSPWRDAAAERLKRDAGVVVLGEGAPRLRQTLSFSAPGFPSDLQVMQMDLAGVMVSAGSACSSGKVKASRVVEAMGLPELSPYALRVSGGWSSTEADWQVFTDAWLKAHANHRARHAAQPAA
ncbi:MAG TPA: cysteine desulfurase family protein [Caulobacteraceae bacterium]|jgi:cysteine desulfurase